MEDKPIYRRVKRVNSSTDIKNDYSFMPRAVFKDNQQAYNVRSGSNYWAVRVPSLKRSKKVWERFYNLFPSLRGLKTYRGYKLKNINK